MKKVSLKQALKIMGYNIEQITHGYNFYSGFLTKDDKFYYFSYEDLRWNPTLMIRTADPEIKDKKGRYADFKGGINTFPDVSKYGIYIEQKRNSKDG